MPLSSSTVVRNRLLASLEPELLASLRPKLSPVELTLRQTLYNTDSVIDAVYFPEAGMISLVANLSDGMQAEVGVIGREGMLGLPLLSGIETPFIESMVQLAGSALRMSAKDFRLEIASNAPFRTLLLRYNEGLQAQVMQTAACNGHHGLEQRLARWLLLAHDRAERDELNLTQEFMAMMLATHRPSVTVSARILQKAGLIQYQNGRINILDRAGLEAASCECYGAVRRRFSALLGFDVPEAYETRQSG